MKILLTNDDGIQSKGILSLYDKLSKNHSVTVVAPAESKSAYSHNISLFNPITIQEIKINPNISVYSCSGTPADCVKFGLCQVYGKDNLPDLIISGINLGENIGHYIYYSGTVAAAIEGGIHKINSIAVSIAAKENPNFYVAAEYIDEFIESYSFNKSKPAILNINIPNIKKDDIKGTKITKHGKCNFIDWYKQQRIGDEIQYYLEGKMEEYMNDTESDYYAVYNDYISITPLTLDRTDYGLYKDMKSNIFF